VYRLACRNNLSIVIRKTGDHEAARALSDEALALINSVLGENHPYSAFAALNRANDLRATGEAAEAREIEERMYRLLKHVLGYDHMDTVGAAYNLSLSVLQAGDSIAGRRLYEQALERTRRIVGLSNPRRAAAERADSANFYIEPTPP
jgi:hypothetical protein